MQGFTTGFHTGLIALPDTTHECKNLLSAASNEEAISTLLQTELDQGYMIDLFTITLHGMESQPYLPCQGQVL